MQVLPVTLYYHSRELRKLGMETVKIPTIPRTMAFPSVVEFTVYVIYYTEDCAVNDSTNTEIKLKTHITAPLEPGVLSRHYRGQILKSSHHYGLVRICICGDCLDERKHRRLPP